MSGLYECIFLDLFHFGVGQKSIRHGCHHCKTYTLFSDTTHSDLYIFVHCTSYIPDQTCLSGALDLASIQPKLTVAVFYDSHALRSVCVALV